MLFFHFSWVDVFWKFKRGVDLSSWFCFTFSSLLPLFSLFILLLSQLIIIFFMLFQKFWIYMLKIMFPLTVHFRQPFILLFIIPFRITLIQFLKQWWFLIDWFPYSHILSISLFSDLFLLFSAFMQLFLFFYHFLSSCFKHLFFLFFNLCFFLQ